MTTTLRAPVAPAPGTLYLVPTPLDFGCPEPTGGRAPLSASLPQHTIATAASLTHWVAENAKSARAFLKRVGAECALAQPLQAQHIVELPRQVHKLGDHDPSAMPGWDASALLQPALQGQPMGLISEAGLPAVADPGSALVRAAHALGVPVCPLVGPVSLLLALAASGLNGQQFAFVGYLPQAAPQRAQRIRALEAQALRSGQTQIAIETPYRNAALLQALLANLQPNTRLGLALGLTLAQQRIWSARVADWPRTPSGWALDLPAVFLFGC